ncbi:dihydrodipicolinate synthase family protein [Tropicimonas isoalkanivorans]|uniref:4-hydroxy-tetrahydrodipicolinate synthase n=1 Tax=Tropicimonas isoalkanivorans TaxID=441112 RepID=A0A1I1Q290_9RHOB|nr:dihydrodipicolinate synthase family protein [Tropicimonas isoalkanivorans]SFD13353.1 4-hydroxy-tetrahydrodipicolinate synthase [Tropicimonas isoalkanivorans]
MRADTDLSGVVAALVTPFDSRHEVDVAGLAAHAGRMLHQGCSFISPFGTTGEGASLSTAQKSAVLTALVESGIDAARMIPGVITSTVDDAAQMVRHIADLGCRAALVIPPFYYDPSGDDGVADFYEAAIARAGAPEIDIILYNFPHFSGVTFTPALVRAVQARLGDRVVGIKDSTGDLKGGLALIDAFPELSIFTGSDAILPQMVAAGGAGMIGGMVNLYAAEAVRLARGEADEEERSRARRRIEIVDGNGGLAVLKAILAKTYDSPAFGRFLPPLRAIASERMLAIEAMLAEGD